jgi:hypothetical protein
MNTVNRTAAFVLLCALALAGCPAEDEGYTIIFDKQGGEGGAESARAVVGQAPPAITVPAKEGWVFYGYRTKENGGQPYYSSTGKGIGRWYIASDTTLYAWWEDGGVSPANLASYLARLPDNTTADSPHTVPLVEGTNISGGGWAAINSAVQSAGRFVILDLWACTAAGNTVTGAGASSPSDSDFNIIQNNQYIKGVVLPSTLTSVGAYALSNCSYLTSVTIPARVTSIGSAAFENCASLPSVTIRDGVTAINSSAFSGCTGLTSIAVDAGNNYYASEDGVLFNKDKTTLIQYPAGKTGAYTIPSSVTSIGDGAFSGCTGLTSVTIGDSVTSIGDGAFSGCTGLTSITIPVRLVPAGSSSSSSGFGTIVSGYTSLAVVLTGSGTIANYAFYGCESLTSVTIPVGVTSIGSAAFTYCKALTSVVIPDSVESIGHSAFFSSRSLESVTIGSGGAKH